MLETLVSLDRAVFLFFNVTLANPVTDLVMPVITSDLYLRILYGAAMALLLWKGNARLRWLVLFSAVALTLTDQVASSFLKPLIDRPRPCHVLSDIHLLVGCGGGKSMPSSHAANAFGQAALFSLCVRRVRWYLWAFAALVAMSRVFVGVHYPGDILGGALLGVAVGVAVTFAFEQFEVRLLVPKRKAAPEASGLEPVEKE